LGSVGLGILKTVTELFKLRKALKGDPPVGFATGDGSEYYTVQAKDNSTVVVDRRTYNIYFKNPKVNDALSQTFKALETDPNIDAFEIDDEKDQPLFEASKPEFAQMALTTSVPQPEKRDVMQDTQVYIMKPSFDSKLKWTILYKGSKTDVWMRDKEFQHRIDSGERFGKGDLLAVDLVIHQRIEPDLNTYVNKSYEIVRVKAHIPRQEQRNLFETPTLATRFLVESTSMRSELPPKPKGTGTGTSGTGASPEPEPDDK
jgi:hypothetical protein